MIAPARTAAFAALREVHAGHVDLPSAMARSRERLRDPRDRSLAFEIVAGTLRWQRRLDYLIAQIASRPLETIDADVLIVLRLSLYQLMHLDRVPAAAVVDDAADLSRAARRAGASGFVNAVLRTALRQRRQLPLPVRPEQTDDRPAALRYLGITHSHPDWLVERWLDRYGFDHTERWVQFDNEPARLALRVNRLRQSRASLQVRLAADGVETDPTTFAPYGLIVTKGNPLAAPLDGSFVVQDEASQLVSHLVGARPGDTVLDVCASPGGKTTDLAADMAGTGLLVACDVRERRMRLLRTAVAASGTTIVRLVQIDTRAALPFPARFDRVLVDAPCSGLGTLRRDPDIRWRRAAHELPDLAGRQASLLGRAAAVVAPGGRLLYATCSSEPEENEDVVDAFLRAHSGFRLVDLRAEVSPALRPLFDDQGRLRTLPFAHNLEAFFAAAMMRVGGTFVVR